MKGSADLMAVFILMSLTAGLREAVEAGLISRRRYTSYVEIYDEVKNKKKY